MLTVTTLEDLRTDVNFDLLWQTVEKTRVRLDVDEPQLYSTKAEGSKEI